MRLDETGGDWRRLDETGRDWTRLGETGGDWRRLEEAGRDWTSWAELDELRGAPRSTEMGREGWADGRTGRS